MWCVFTVSDRCWLLAFNVTDSGWTIKKKHCNQNWQWVKKICCENLQHKRLVVTGHTGPDQESSLASCSGEQSKERRLQKSRAFIPVSAISDNKIRRQKYLTFLYVNREAAQPIQAQASSPHNALLQSDGLQLLVTKPNCSFHNRNKRDCSANGSH